MKVHINGREVDLGGRYVGTELRDSTDAVRDGDTLRQRLHGDGYLLLRGLLDRPSVLDTRRAILEPLERDGIFEPGTPLLDGVLRSDETRPMFRSDWKTPELRALTTGTAIRDLFERVLGGDVVTYDYKWLRAVGRGFHTGLHWDSIYWETGEVYSAWIPLGDIPIAQGPLAVLCGVPEFFEEARRAPRQLREAFKFWSTIDAFDVLDRSGGRLETTDFEAGDVIVFTMHTPHTTLKNQTDRIRVSTDVRFQLTSEPLDMHYMGENPSHVEVIRDSYSHVAGRTDLIGRQS